MDIKYEPFNAASGQLSPRKIAPTDNCPMDDFPSDNCPRTIIPVNNCPRGKLSPNNCPWDNFSPDNNPKTIAPEENCPVDDFSPVLGQLLPRKTVPRINYTEYIFTRRIGNRSTLIDSCFFLFFFFEV